MARILVIDDDLDLLQMMRLILQRAGHEAILTGDGADGIAKALQVHPDMAIVDVMMPGMNGYQVVRKLREDPATSDITILVLTARAQPVDRDAALAAHADGYMAKPVSPAELLQNISELLRKRGQASLPNNIVLTVFSLRGGVGKTTIAVNLALTLRQAGREVCLVDFSERSGHAAMQMRMQAKTSWAEALAQIDSLSSDALDPLLLRHESGLQLLPSPFLPLPQSPPGEAVARLLGLLKLKFNLTVVDLGAWDDAGRAVISSSELLLVILSPEVASLQTTAATLRVIKAMNVPDEKSPLVLNCVVPKAGLAASAIEKALGRPLTIGLPYDELQVQALGQGAPLALSQPAAPLAASVRQLIQVLSSKQTAKR
jgi:pilus assembly protein CpaE